MSGTGPRARRRRPAPGRGPAASAGPRRGTPCRGRARWPTPGGRAGRPSRSRARRARRSRAGSDQGGGTGGGTGGGQPQDGVGDPVRAGRPRRRDRPGPPPRACPRRRSWPGPGRRRCRRAPGPRRRRPGRRRPCRSGRRPAPRRRRRSPRSGRGRRRPGGRSSPAAPWSSAVRRTPAPGATVRWRSPGAMCTVPGAMRRAGDRLDHGQRAEPVQPAGELPGEHRGHVLHHEHGQREVAGQPRDDPAERVRAPGGGPDDQHGRRADRGARGGPATTARGAGRARHRAHRGRRRGHRRAGSRPGAR